MEQSRRLKFLHHPNLKTSSLNSINNSKILEIKVN